VVSSLLHIVVTRMGSGDYTPRHVLVTDVRMLATLAAVLRVLGDLLEFSSFG
jgi:hypothetical protein